jgi:tetratricopeptide (TPR) repeat protein
MVNRLSWTPVRVLLFTCAGLLAALFPTWSEAEMIDRVDIQQAGKDAEITIRFTSPIQYQRHAPKDGGNLLQIMFQAPGVQLAPDARINPEVQKQSAPGLLLPIIVSYPDPNGALTVRFSKKTTWRVRIGRDQRSISVLVPIDAAPKGSEPVSMMQPTTPAGLSELEKRANALYGQVLAVRAKGDHELAIETLNSLLNLPPNSRSEEAQVMIGEERQASGELAKAQVEYNLYLKLYPDGQYAIKVKKQLASIASGASQNMAEGEQGRRPVARREMDTGWVLTGSLSQNYYVGKSQIDTSTRTVDQNNQLTFFNTSLSAVDQSALVSSLDVMYRRRTTGADSRFIFRDTDTQNFLAGQRGQNRLNSAYFERNDKDMNYLVRAGRQSGSSGGVLGRFDGVWAGYNLNPSWRVNAVAGLPVEYDVNWNKSIVGASVDMIPQPQKITGSAYVIGQRVDGLDDRQAVGLELHYFDDHSNYFSQIDYDVMFGKLNIAMLQGNYTLGNGVNLIFLADHRKSTPLQLTNATQSLMQGTLQAALNAGISISQLRNLAVLKTADSDQFQFGFTKQFTPRWQLGADYRLAKISSYWFEDSSTGNLIFQPATGAVNVYSVQAIGSGLFLVNDVGVANASFIVGPSYDAQSVTLSHVLNLQKLRFDTIIGYYTQKNNEGTVMHRWSPILRASYKVRESWYLESELGIEDSKSTGTTSNENTNRKYFYIGYRWEW